MIEDGGSAGERLSAVPSDSSCSLPIILKIRTVIISIFISLALGFIMILSLIVSVKYLTFDLIDSMKLPSGVGYVESIFEPAGLIIIAFLLVASLPLSISLSIFLYKKITPIIRRKFQWKWWYWHKNELENDMSHQCFSEVQTNPDGISRIQTSKIKIFFIFIKKLFSVSLSIMISFLFVICMSYVTIELFPLGQSPNAMSTNTVVMEIFGWIIVFISWCSISLAVPLTVFLYKKINNFTGCNYVK
jgi:hypothetical protein